MTLQITEPQAQFLRCDKENIAFCAGYGSGKSFIATLKTIQFCLENPGINAAYYLPTYGLIRDIAFDKFPDLLVKMGIEYRLNKSAAEIELPATENKIIFRSMDKPETIVGYENGFTIIDEADILPELKMEVAYNKILARNRKKLPNGEPNRIAVVSTPEGFKFLYKRFVKQFNEERDALIKASTYSNPFLPESYIRTLEEQYPENLLKAYLNGEFVNLATGNVYPYFDRERHHRSRTVESTDKAVHIGMDFNVGGCVSIVHIVEEDTATAVAEIVADDTPKTIARVRELYPDKLIFVYPDAAGNARKTNAAPTDVAQLRQAGFNVRVNATNPFIKDRVNTLNNLLDKNRYFVNTDLCPRLTEALEQQAYTDKGEPEKFDLHPAVDDFNDAAGYFAHKRFGINRTGAKIMRNV